MSQPFPSPKPIAHSLKQIAHEVANGWVKRVTLRSNCLEDRKLAYEQGFFAGMVRAMKKGRK